AGLITMIGRHGEWADVAGAHEALLRAAAARHGVPPIEEIGRLAALVRAHPSYPRATAARLWIGDTWLRLGRLASARAAYDEAVAGAVPPEGRFRAPKAGAAVMGATGDFGGAEALYPPPRRRGPVEGAPLAAAVRELDTQRTRVRRMRVATAFLLLVLIAAVASARRDAGSWRAAARALARPPIEVAYAAPVAAGLALLAASNDAAV